jgi:hypothetical protein
MSSADWALSNKSLRQPAKLPAGGAAAATIDWLLSARLSSTGVVSGVVGHPTFPRWKQSMSDYCIGTCPTQIVAA